MRTFIDTNVFVYTLDDGSPVKRDRARERIETEQRDREVVVSTQVLQEMFNSLTRGKYPIATAAVAEETVRKVARGFVVVQVDVALILAAIESSRRSSISFWDAMVVRAAAGAGCDRLLTEDLNHGQVIDGVRIENPFA